eukprot:scaffold287_cov337-Pavlova_lutheri.AAC.236
MEGSKGECHRNRTFVGTERTRRRCGADAAAAANANLGGEAAATAERDGGERTKGTVPGARNEEGGNHGGRNDRVRRRPTNRLLARTSLNCRGNNKTRP